MDTAHTFEPLTDAAENESGSRLTNALDIAQRSPVAHVAPADRVQPDVPDLADVTGSTTWDVLTALGSTGYVIARTEFVEQSGDTYLSEGRVITVAQVVKPFTVVTPDQSETVPAGWYLVGEINEDDHAPALVCVAGMNELPNDVVTWLYELDGFGASTCLAGCATCGSQWRAEAGSWTFQPDGCDAESWAFDDAEDFRTDTIACPACTAGRVGFTVY